MLSLQLRFDKPWNLQPLHGTVTREELGFRAAAVPHTANAFPGTADDTKEHSLSTYPAAPCIQSPAVSYLSPECIPLPGVGGVSPESYGHSAMGTGRQ